MWKEASWYADTASDLRMIRSYEKRVFRDAGAAHRYSQSLIHQLLTLVDRMEVTLLFIRQASEGAADWDGCGEGCRLVIDAAFPVEHKLAAPRGLDVEFKRLWRSTYAKKSVKPNNDWSPASAGRRSTDSVNSTRDLAVLRTDLPKVYEAGRYAMRSELHTRQSKRASGGKRTESGLVCGRSRERA